MARRKDSGGTTLAEHTATIGKKGGTARAENLTPQQLSEIGRRGGLAGGVARAEALSPEERSAIAKKAAEAMWAKRRAAAKKTAKKKD